jgi:Fe-S-cluster-containing dehydrogenase component
LFCGRAIIAALRRPTGYLMPYVVTESCIQCKYTDCVAVCPMDCFHAGPNFLVIDPDACIDCSQVKDKRDALVVAPE